jgi:hypothetical protein
LENRNYPFDGFSMLVTAVYYAVCCKIAGHAKDSELSKKGLIMNILVTGAAGYIGGKLVKILCRKDWVGTHESR